MSFTKQRRLLVASSLVLSLFAAIFAASATMAPQAQAAAGLRYVRGYSVQSGWLCYGWSNGAYHCTQHWTRSNGKYISFNTPFVPSQGSASAGGSGLTSTPVQTTAQVTAGQPCRSTVQWPKTISQWTVPLGCYAGVYFPNPKNYPSRPSYGWCNWWPEVLHPSMGGSTALHMPSHSTPRVGAVVFFAPGVQGASSDGHYAQVVAIHGNWVLVTEMNFTWRGAGFRKVDYRFIHLGSGVSFRY